MRRQLLIAAFVVFAIYSYVYVMFRADVRAGKPDFVIFQTAGTMVYSGEGQNLYDVARQHEVQRSIVGDVPERAVPLLFNHAPFEAVLFAPLGALSFERAYFVWFVIDISLILVFAHMATSRLPTLSRYSASIAIASAVFYGTLMTVVQGQDSGLQLCLITGFFAALLNKKERAAGVLIALATIKPHLVLPELFLLLVLRRWRALFAFVGALAALLVVSGIFLGFSTVLSYPAFLLAFAKGGAAAQLGVYPQVMASLRGLLLMAGVSASLTSKIVFVALIAAAVAVVVLARYVRDNRSLQLFGGAVVCGSIFFSLHVNPHDLILLLLPIAIAVGEFQDNSAPRGVRVALVAVSAALYLIPLVHLNFQILAVLVFGLGAMLAYAAVAAKGSMTQTPLAAAER